MTTRGKIILTVLTLAALSYFVRLNMEVAAAQQPTASMASQGSTISQLPAQKYWFN